MRSVLVKHLPAVLAVFAFSGCALPGIIVLHDPLSAAEHEELGRIYEAGGERSLAVSEYRTSARKDPHATAPLLRLADLAYRDGDLDGALSLYEQALDRDQQSGDALNNLAWLLLSDGKLERARRYAERAAALHSPGRPWYLDTLGVVLLKQGAADEAVAVLTEALAAMPDEPRERQREAEIHLNAARAAAAATSQRNEVRSR